MLLPVLASLLVPLVDPVSVGLDWALLDSVPVLLVLVELDPVSVGLVWVELDPVPVVLL